MRLPSKLLGCMRVGVGVGAVMLGGCDAIAEAKARVLGEEPAAAEAAAEADAPATAPVAETPVAPEPMLLPRDGVAGVVADTIARSNTAERTPSTVPPVEDLGRPRTEPEGSRSFVPFVGSGGVIAGATPTPEREVASSKPRVRPRPKLARPVEDEPCDPSIATPTPIAAPEREWSCGPCGRG